MGLERDDWNNWNFGTLGTCASRKRFERSEAVERLERLERTDLRDERSAAIEPFDRTQGRRLERLEQAQAKIVLRLMKDSRATISSVDHMINKSSLLPARDSWHGRGLSHSRLLSHRGKYAELPLYSPEALLCPKASANNGADRAFRERWILSISLLNNLNRAKRLNDWNVLNKLLC